MNAVEFLVGPVADLPKTRSEPYPQFMERIFSDYQAAIQQVNAPHSLEAAIRRQLPKVQALSGALRQVIVLAVSGDREVAYARLRDALEGVKPHLSMLMPPGDKSALINPMYRFRTARNRPLAKGELFHIPFHLRHIVGSMRYSVAGLPSLYLGGSTDVCWRELGRPDLNDIAVSRFEAVQGTGLKVLNFGFRPRLLGAMVNEFPSDYEGDSDGAIMILANVACWPLIAACSIRVPDRSATDRPEYLVPQLMLDWVTRTHDYHGIRYFSTHYSEYPDNPKTYMNYVFPARRDAESGYCADLCDLFNLTDPVSWAEAKAVPPAGVDRPRYRTRTIMDNNLESEFGRAEDGLLGLPVGHLDPWVILPVHAARHEAAHAVFSWVTGVPFDSVHNGGQPGTGHAGYILQNSNAVAWAKARMGDRQAVIKGLFFRLMASSCVAEIIDERVNNLPPEIAAARAGAPYQGAEIRGDRLNSAKIME